MLLIADEVITGFGRRGSSWGTQRYGIEPDMITFAKGVTSGYMPLGGVLVGERVQAPFWDEPIAGAVFRHGYTYSGHSGAAAAAMANLDIIEREDLVERVAMLEPVLDKAVRRLEGAPLVGEIRTVGLTAAVAIEPAAAREGSRDAGQGRRARRSSTASRAASCAPTRSTSRRRS